MKVKRIAECSPWSILQYFWPALSDNLSWKLIFGLFERRPFYTGFTVFTYSYKFWVEYGNLLTYILVYVYQKF